MSANDRERTDPFPDPEVPTEDEDGLIVPPWVKYPNLPRRSMGWRMGVGEQYLEEFRRRFFAQPRADRVAAKAKYPEPDEWRGFYESLR